MTITPKNWNTFQHYKDRKPAWIKLHHALLDDYQFSCLPVASRALAPCLWLLASEYEGGEITAPPDEIAFRLRMSASDLFEALKPLIDSGFFIASNPLADCKQDAIPEIEGEIEEESKKDAAPSARTMISAETELYRRGKEILGTGAGGLIKRVVQNKGGDIALARAAVEIASTKQDPREYIGAIIRGRDGPEDARARGDAW
jgi:hypothetical protein